MRHTMKSVLVLFLMFLGAAVFAGAKQRRYYGSEEDLGSEELTKHQQMRAQETSKVKRVFDCKQKYEKCGGIIKCCGTLQCFWSEGYSLITSGRCVECVQRLQKCQRDAQCCSGMVCHKGNRYYVDGQCDVRRFTGAECHEHNQCISGSCQTSVGQKIKGSGGVCA